MISLNKFPKIKHRKIIVDVNNVVYFRNNQEKKPSLKLYLKLRDTLCENWGVSSDQIIGICDAPLEYHIDEKQKLTDMIKSGEIHKVPSGKRADDFIILLAEEYELSLIISNDAFKDYSNEVDGQWLKEKRVAFMFIDDKVLLSPCISFSRLKERESVKLEHKFEESEKNSTMDVLNRICEKNGEFDLYK